MTRALTISMLLLLFVAPLFQSSVFAQETLRTSFTHEILVHEHGFIKITEHISFTNQSPSATSISPFEFHYPKTVSKSIGAYSAEPNIDSVRIEDEADFARIIVTPSGNFALQPGQSQTYQVTLLLTDVVRERVKDEFFFTLPLAPNISLPVENVSIRIVLPDRSSIIGQPSGFSLRNGSRQVWEGFSQPALTVQELGFRVEQDSSFAIISFPEAKREIFVDSFGDVLVREQVEVVNAGNRSVTQIKLNPIGDSVNIFTILPTSVPPLASPVTLRIENNILVVGNIYSRLIEKGEKRVISFQYPYPSDLKEVDGQRIHLNASVSSPVEGVVKSYHVSFIYPSTFEAVADENSLSLQNVGYVDGNFLAAGLRPKAVWAAGEIMPVATTLFAALFAALYLAGGFIGTAASQKMKSAFELKRLMEDKIVENRSMFSELERLVKTQASRKDIEDIRIRMEDARARSSRRLPEISEEIAKQGGNIQRTYQTVLEADREYDREARALLNAYRNYLSTSGRPEALKVVVNESKRRLTRSEERLSEQLEQLTRAIS